MSGTRETLRAIAAETLAILDRGSYTAPSGRSVAVGEDLRCAIAGVRLYRPGELEVPPTASPGGATRLEVTDETTLAAARRLGGPDEVACLNFASARNPGGGFLNGAQAQEESLARASGLYPTLLAAPGYYEFHRARRDPLYSDHVIYAPRVPVFRDDSGTLLEEPYTVAFLTSPAPNRGALRDREAAGALPGILKRRAAAVLTAGLRHGHTRLVLGAWGCGVFRNNPREVAGAFAALLLSGGAFEGRFEHVVFAVFDPKEENRPAFERIFSGSSMPGSERTA